MRIALRSSSGPRWELLLVAVVAIVGIAGVTPVARRFELRISGTVHGVADVSPAWVTAWNTERQVVASVEDGRWSMMLPAGEYRIGASRMPVDPPADAALDITVDADLDGIALLLDQEDVLYASRTAIVRRGEPTWIEGAVSGVRNGAITIEVSSKSSELLARRVVRVQDGAYRLRVMGTPSAVAVNRWPIRDYRSELPVAGAGTVRVDVDVTDAPVVTVFGRVIDRAGLPAADVEVEAYHPHDLTGQRAMTRTSGDGLYALPVRAGGRIAVHHNGLFVFKAAGVGPGPWPMPLNLASADEVSTDCFYQRNGVRYYPPSEDELARLQALAVGRAYWR